MTITHEWDDNFQLDMPCRMPYYAVKATDGIKMGNTIGEPPQHEAVRLGFMNATRVEARNAHTSQRPVYHPERHQNRHPSRETLLRTASRNRIQNPTLYDPIDYFRQRKVRLDQEKASPRRHAGRASVQQVVIDKANQRLYNGIISKTRAHNGRS
jgi:hypothetical protein